MKEIPFLQVSGSHFACGEQIGSAFKNQIYQYLDLCKNDPPANLSWQECIKHASRFIEPTQKYFPEIIDEIKGTAQGTGIDFVELFALTVEELYSESYSLKGCTDIVLLPPASDHTLVAHNNDLPPSFYDALTSIEWNFDDGSQMFTVGLGFMASVGVNDSKVVLSGNALTPTDTRAGIPRALIARAILLAKTFDEAIKIATHPERASSYNNVITTPNQTVSVEGSATNHELIFPKKGILTHSNHYCSPKMLSYEGHPNYTSSIQRLDSADKLTSDIKNQIDLKTAESFLSDHGPENIGNDNTVCRHGESSATLFGFAVDLDTGIVELTSGNPCENDFKKVWQIK
jgi:isopenicillin-N N-acyltransferase-like protein